MERFIAPDAANDNQSKEEQIFYEKEEKMGEFRREISRYLRYRPDIETELLTDVTNDFLLELRVVATGPEANLSDLTIHLKKIIAFSSSRKLNHSEKLLSLEVVEETDTNAHYFFSYQ